MSSPRLRIPFATVFCLVVQLFAGCGNTTSPSDWQIANDHCWSPGYNGGVPGGKMSLDTQGQWTQANAFWVSRSQYSYSVPYEVRAALFEVERLTPYPAAGPKPKAGTRVFPVRIHKVIERRYSPGNISVETLTSVIPPRSEEDYTAYYYIQRGVYVWEWTTNPPARGR